MYAVMQLVFTRARRQHVCQLSPNNVLILVISKLLSRFLINVLPEKNLSKLEIKYQIKYGSFVCGF